MSDARSSEKIAVPHAPKSCFSIGRVYSIYHCSNSLPGIRQVLVSLGITRSGCNFVAATPPSIRTWQRSDRPARATTSCSWRWLLRCLSLDAQQPLNRRLEQLTPECSTAPAPARALYYDFAPAGQTIWDNRNGFRPLGMQPITSGDRQASPGRLRTLPPIKMSWHSTTSGHRSSAGPPHRTRRRCLTVALGSRPIVVGTRRTSFLMAAGTSSPVRQGRMSTPFMA